VLPRDALKRRVALVAVTGARFFRRLDEQRQCRDVLHSDELETQASILNCIESFRRKIFLAARIPQVSSKDISSCKVECHVAQCHRGRNRCKEHPLLKTQASLQPMFPDSSDITLLIDMSAIDLVREEHRRLGLAGLVVSLRT